MATKTYQSIHRHLSTYFSVGGASKRIIFNGSSNGSLGIFTTADKSEQEAIENSDRFKAGEIYIIGEYPLENEKSEPAVVVVEKVIETPADTNTEPTEKASGKVYDNVTTVQGASRILRSEYGITTALNTREKVLEKATELGISFNLQQ